MKKKQEFQCGLGRRRNKIDEDKIELEAFVNVVGKIESLATELELIIYKVTKALTEFRKIKEK